MISVAALSTATPTQLLLQSSTRTHLHSALFLSLSLPLLSGSDWECVRACVTCLHLRLLHTLHTVIIIIIICHFVAFINWPGVKSATLTPTSATWHGSFCYCYQKTHTHKHTQCPALSLFIECALFLSCSFTHTCCCCRWLFLQFLSGAHIRRWRLLCLPDKRTSCALLFSPPPPPFVPFVAVCCS